MEDSSPIRELARRQLAHYNAADLDGFCACYHPEVVVESDGEVTVEGIDAFRERYRPMFAAGSFSATVDERMSHGAHCVDLEDYRRADGSEGRVLVHYTLRDGLIGRVRFWR